MKTAIMFLLFTFFAKGLHAQNEKTIALGPVVSVPLHKFGYPSRFSAGVGGEVMGQYKFSRRWSALLQGGVSYYTADAYCDYSPCDPTYPDRIISIRAGARYDFGRSGIFLHLLPGIDKRYRTQFFSALTAGGGKRFRLSRKFYLEPGVDYVTESGYNMLKLKVYFGLLHKGK